MKIDKSWYIKPKDENFPTKINAGGVVVRKTAGESLVALIRDRNFPDFSLPKGGVENREEILEAAKREISEETGLKGLNFVCKLGVKERLTFGKDKWATTHYYLFTTTEEKGEQDLQEDEDVEVKWFGVDNLPEFFWPEQKEIIEDNLEIIKSTI